ncbi:Panacea domain-containing protein [Rhizobium tumorigenes]|uniref:Panacea domain-containing protein n=1 Tax=Rhizobium tumorigenes TaxID=2041385 RepID=UPI00241FAAC5|nr:Panacea domain-containing protein [Rhizobium tumorigenes]WFS00631.1 Panacea domain-containing protein [Rhizobium tumorigenes]
MMKETVLRFQFDEKKGVEAVTFIASRWPDVTAFFAAKILFFAEKYHLNRYARPIVADTFIAMPNGPVPSTIYDFIKGRLHNAGDPESITNAFTVAQSPWPRVNALRAADTSVLSESDIECLDEAIQFCRRRNFGTLSTLTHQERSWIEAPANGVMDYEAMIDDDNPSKDEIVEEAKEFAIYGVL